MPVIAVIVGMAEGHVSWPIRNTPDRRIMPIKTGMVLRMNMIPPFLVNRMNNT
jgi:hypothetical protein